TCSTAEPTACTQPAFSWPRVYGSATPLFSRHWPSMMCRSVRHNPAPPMRTITSCGPVSAGSATSSTSGRRPYSFSRTAFIAGPSLGNEEVADGVDRDHPVAGHERVDAVLGPVGTRVGGPLQQQDVLLVDLGL